MKLNNIKKTGGFHKPDPYGWLGVCVQNKYIVVQDNLRQKAINQLRDNFRVPELKYRKCCYLKL